MEHGETERAPWGDGPSLKIATDMESVLLISLEGWWMFLSVIDVGEISCTGCRFNRKKPFKITCLNRIPVLRCFFSSVHTYLHA